MSTTIQRNNHGIFERLKENHLPKSKHADVTEYVFTVSIAGIHKFGDMPDVHLFPSWVVWSARENHNFIAYISCLNCIPKLP